ncbi:MAG: helix-turn-helix transcriptional regulator [Deltaproteobacteria bacterium]|nr:helix-turn-helix transcriptional regulator [Deltaproteobacteria bacterium]
MAKLTIKELVGARVRDIRKERGLTQQKLADRTHLSLNMIGYVERGIKFPSADTFEKLSKALAVTPDRLFKSDPKDAKRGKK